MKKNISCIRLSPVRLLGAISALTLSAFCGFSQPQVAQAVEHDRIARMMLDLQSSPDRWIQIDLTEQKLMAWEGNKVVYAVSVSTGTEKYATPPGTFAVQTKYEVTRMQGEDYDVPDVPFTMYYYGGYAIHGAYWHNNFGTPMSHGCTNVAVNHAEWLFNWADVGTPIVVHH
ncbi:MAG TPA: L,D-transpeptidase [Vampirovibrionales bacterium]